MLTYQPTKFMTDLLQKVQVLQIAVAGVNDGHSLHVDVNSNEHYDRFGETARHISFDVTLFDEAGIVKSWDFMGQMDEDELNHNLEDLTFHISRL